jgi:hypothetical protein
LLSCRRALSITGNGTMRSSPSQPE